MFAPTKINHQKTVSVQNPELNFTNASGSRKSDVFGTKYIWTIENFSHLSSGPEITSPTFVISLPNCEIEFRIKIRPVGAFHLSFGDAEYIHGFVERISPIDDKFRNFKVVIGLLNRFGVPRIFFALHNACFRNNFGIGGKLVKSEHLYAFNHEFCLSPIDKLTVLCEVSTLCNVSDVQVTNSKVDDKLNTKIVSDLFKTRKFSDFKLIVNGKIINVHKCILATRSTVFENILSSNPTEMEMTDLCYDAAIEFVRFIYIGGVNDITEHAKELLLASINYKIEGLQSICYENIVSNRNVVNVAELLKFADDHNITSLKEAALDFFKKHSKQIVKTEGFKKLNAEKPMLILNYLFKDL